MADIILDIRNLSVSYRLENGLLQALSDFSLQICQRETVCLVGESGSGKTTLANSIPKLLPLSAKVEGDIIVEGRDVYKLPEKELMELRKKRISFVFQDPVGSLVPNTTIGKQIERVVGFRLEINDRARRIAKSNELLQQVGLTEISRIYTSYPQQLSGGMCQRVMIALALSVDPALVIADEPVSQLDALTQETILGLLKELQKTHGFAILLITHDMRVAAHYSDYVGVMNAGRLLEFKQTKDLLSNPTEEYSRRLVESANRISVIAR